MDLGKEMLASLMSDEEAIKEASRNIDWDQSSHFMVRFIKSASLSNSEKREGAEAPSPHEGIHE